VSQQRILKTSSSTAAHADGSLEKPPKQVRTPNKISRSLGHYILALCLFYSGALAKTFVYSMSVDGEVRNSTPGQIQGGKLPMQTGYVAGSRALDTLDKMITSTESFFHPSNSGPWSALVGTSSMITALGSDFRMPSLRHLCTSWLLTFSGAQKRRN
jgi:proteasome activator subunit 4